MVEREQRSGTGRRRPSREWLTPRWWLGVAAGWAVLYLVTAVVLTHAFPVADDFDVLRSLNRIDERPDDVWFQLLAQHHEHRIVFARLVFLAVSPLPSLPLPLVTFIGSLLLLAIPALYARARADSPTSITDPSRWSLTLATVVLVAFNMTTAENMLFAMAAVSNHGVVAFSLLAIYGAVRGRAWLGVSWASATVATFTSVQGVLAWPVMLALLAVQRRWRALGVTAGISAVVLFGFFRDYVLPASARGDLLELPMRAARALIVGLSILGSFLGIPGRSVPALSGLSLVVTVVLGAVLLGVVVRFLKVGTDGSVLARFALWSGVFEVLVAFAMGYGRQSIGLDQGLASRYHLHSIVAVIAVLVLVEVHRGGPRALRVIPPAGSRLVVRVAAALAVLSFAFPLYFHYVAFAPAGRGELVHPHPEKVAPILQEAIDRGIFEP